MDRSPSRPPSIFNVIGRHLVVHQVADHSKPGAKAVPEDMRSAALASAHGALSDRFRAATRLYLIKLAFETTSRSNRQGVARRLPIAICVAPMLDPSWILKPSYRPAGRPPIHAAQPAALQATSDGTCVAFSQTDEPERPINTIAPDLFFVRRA